VALGFSPKPLARVHIGEHTFIAEVADTESLREQGLGGRAGLPKGRVMLFVFDTPDSWGIWMKDMRFALDIVWARSDGTIINIERNVLPESYPHVYYPRESAAYVVEFPAGEAEGIAEGDKLVVEYKERAGL